MSDLQIQLIKYNKKTWGKSALLGFFIGLAVIVPGISGSTVAIIFKLYDQFLYAIGNLFKEFKKCFTFLLPIGIGLVLGVALGFLGVKSLLDILPFAIVCLFAGLMTGAFPAVYDEVKGTKKTPSKIALFAVGVLIPVAIGVFSALVGAGAENGEIAATGDGDLLLYTFLKIDIWTVLLAVLFGAVVGITQIVPGLSASAFLMAVGWFNDIVKSVSLTYWKSNPAIFLVYGGLAVGFLLGLFFFSKLLTYVFGKCREGAYSMIVGLSLGSILSMFCNGDIMSTYLSWADGTANFIALDIALGVVLFIVGLIGSYLLVRYQRKKDEKTAQSAAIFEQE